jgi:hypothetical protein
MIHNLDRVALSTVTTVPTTLLSHCLANCSEASVAGQQTRLPLLPHWCSYQQSHRWIPHLTKSSAILFGSVEQKVEQELHQLPITSIKYLSNFMKLYEMNMRCTYLTYLIPSYPFLVSCRMDSVRSPAGLSPGEHLVSINLDLLGRSSGARRTKSGNLHLHSSPFATTTLCHGRCNCWRFNNAVAPMPWIINESTLTLKHMKPCLCTQLQSWQLRSLLSTENVLA